MFYVVCTLCVNQDVGIIMLTVKVTLFRTASISFFVPHMRWRLPFCFNNPCLAIRLTHSISPSETAANPTSITSTPSSSKRWAIVRLLSGTEGCYEVFCSPSRRVVSKNFTCLGKRLNKAICRLKIDSLLKALSFDA